MSDKLAKRLAEAESLFQEGAIYFYAGRFAEALTAFNAAVLIAPDFSRAHAARGWALAQLGRGEEGLAAARRALELDARNARAYTAVGVCLHRLGNRDEAREYYERALAIAPDDPANSYNYACFWAEQQDEPRCRQYLSQAAEHDNGIVADYALRDPDLARYVPTAWFRELVALSKKKRHLNGKDNGVVPHGRT